MLFLKNKLFPENAGSEIAKCDLLLPYPANFFNCSNIRPKTVKKCFANGVKI
jgi:hypothetical protein